MEKRLCKALPNEKSALADYTWNTYSFYGHAIALPHFEGGDTVTLAEHSRPSPLQELAPDNPETLRLLHVRCPSGEFVSDGGAILRELPRASLLLNGGERELLERLYKEKEICRLGNAVAVKLVGGLSPDAACDLLLGFADRAAKVTQCLMRQT